MRMPPSTGPAMGPIRTGTLRTAIAVPLRSAGTARSRRVMATGTISPPPAPCTTRKAISDPVSQATPHRPDPAVNSATETRNTRRPPQRSTAQPVTGRTAASARV